MPLPPRLAEYVGYAQEGDHVFIAASINADHEAATRHTRQNRIRARFVGSVSRHPIGAELATADEQFHAVRRDLYERYPPMMLRADLVWSARDVVLCRYNPERVPTRLPPPLMGAACHQRRLASPRTAQIMAPLEAQIAPSPHPCALAGASATS